MNIIAIRSDNIYTKMVQASAQEKENLYRFELMKPFEFKWQCVGMPLKAERDGGYDVVSARTMGGGYHPSQITAERLSEIEKAKKEYAAEVKSVGETPKLSQRAKPKPVAIMMHSGKCLMVRVLPFYKNLASVRHSLWLLRLRRIAGNKQLLCTLRM